MNYNLSYHNVDHSSAFEDYVAKKLKGISKEFRNVGHIQFVADKKGPEYVFSANVNGQKHSFYKRSKGDNVYKAAANVLVAFKNWYREQKSAI